MTEEKPLAPYKHAEAFCLMLYKCEKCHRVENFWNSRDGVTPFIVIARCLDCQGNMQHFEFQQDKCLPDHVPYRGQGVFTDMPDALKRTYAHMRAIKQKALYKGEFGDTIERGIYESFQPGEPFFFRWGL